MLKKTILALGVWELQKYFNLKSVHCLKEKLGANVEELMDRFEVDIFLGLQTSSPNIAFFNKLNLREHFLKAPDIPSTRSIYVFYNI